MSTDESPSRSPRKADTTEIPWARTTTMPTVATPHGDPGPAAPVPPRAGLAAAEPGFRASAPAVTPPTWSGKKTAIAAALAIGFSAIGAMGAAAAMPAGATSDSGPGGGLPGGGQFPPGGQQGQLGRQGPPGTSSQNGTQQLPDGLRQQDGTQQFGGPGHLGVPGGPPDSVTGQDGQQQVDPDDGTSTT